MVFLFRDKSLINIFYLVMLSMLVHVHFFVHAPTVMFGLNDGLFSLFLKKYFTQFNASALFIFYHAIVLIQAIRLNLVLNQLKMFAQPNFAVAMAYVLCTGLFAQWNLISPALLANFVLIWILIKLSKLFNHPNPKTLLFNTGLIIGISILLYHPTVFLVLVALFALAIVRPFHLSEWIILMLGVILPYYFLASFLFLTDSFHQFSPYLPKITLGLPKLRFDISNLIGMGLMILTLFSGFFNWQRAANRSGILVRKNWSVILVMLISLFPIPFIFGNSGNDPWILGLIPFACFAGMAYAYPKRLWVPNILFWLFLAIIMYNNWVFVKNLASLNL